MMAMVYMWMLNVALDTIVDVVLLLLSITSIVYLWMDIITMRKVKKKINILMKLPIRDARKVLERTIQKEQKDKDSNET